MYLYSLFGAMIVGGLVGWAADRFGFVRHGIVTSLILGIGGAVIAYFVMALLGLGIGGRTMTAAIGALIALFVAPRLGKR